MFSEFDHSEERLTPYLVDLPGFNEVLQQKLAKVAKQNVESATSFVYVMSYTQLRNSQDFDAIKAIYDRDKSKSLPPTHCPGNVLLFTLLVRNE